MSAEARPGWRSGDAVLAILAGFMTAVAAQVMLGAGEVSVVAVFGVIVPAQALGTVVAIVAIGRGKGIDIFESLGIAARGADAVGLAVGAALQIVLSLAVVLVVRGVFRSDPPTQEVVRAAGDAVGPFEGVLVVLGAGLIAPVAEELAFRGVLLRALLDRHGRRVATYGSAGAFAAVHLIDPNAVVAVPVLFVAGIVLARQVLATGRITRSVLTHIGFNLVSVIVLLSVSGSVGPP